MLWVLAFERGSIDCVVSFCRVASLYCVTSSYCVASFHCVTSSYCVASFHCVAPFYCGEQFAVGVSHPVVGQRSPLDCWHPRKHGRVESVVGSDAGRGWHRAAVVNDEKARYGRSERASQPDRLARATDSDACRTGRHHHPVGRSQHVTHRTVDTGRAVHDRPSVGVPTGSEESAQTRSSLLARLRGGNEPQ